MAFKSASRSKFDAIRKKIAEKDTKSNDEVVDWNSWKFRPTLQGSKSSYVVRILPNIHVDEGQSEPWIETKAHMIPTPKKEGISYLLCPKTLGKEEECPICELSKEFYDRGDQVGEKQGQLHYHKRRYHVNVLVLEDDRKDEESQKGKVLVWEFGPKVFTKLTNALTMHEMMFWDVEEGYNLNIVITKDGNFNSYDMSDFDRKQSTLEEVITKYDCSDIDIDTVESSIYNLSEKVIGDGPKTYDELYSILKGETNKKDETTTSKTKSTESEGVEINEDETPVAVDEVDFDNDTVSEETETTTEDDGEDFSLDDINFDSDDDPPF